VGNLYGDFYDASSSGGDVFRLSAASGYARSVILYSFSNSSTKNGSFAAFGVTLDHNQIIGTTAFGGLYGDGTVFNLGYPKDVVLTLLHSFEGTQTKPADGEEPNSAPVPGPQHLLYGATYQGGGSLGYGTVYAVSGSITSPYYKVIHRFAGRTDGAKPTVGALAVDGQGRLYGVTFLGGANNGGTLYMMQKVMGAWQEQVIYDFPASGSIGGPGSAYGNVVLDGAGNLYSCAAGGAHGQGELFRLSPPAAAGEPWQPTVLYDFGDQAADPIVTPDTEGCFITLDPATLFIVGTSAGGGSNGAGAIWQLKPPAAGQTRWHEAVDHSFFGGFSNDGGSPLSAPFKLGNTLSGAIYAFTPNFE
jgi:hypothetical protein